MPIDLELRVATWEANPQLESPFFSTLPAEIRRAIYSYALAPEMYTYAGRDFRHDFRIAHNHDGDPDDDIRDELERWRRGCPGGPEAVRETLKTWITEDWRPDRWKGIEGYHPDPYGAAPSGRSTRPFTCTSERPGYTGRPVLRPTILLACRRVYTEAYPILFEENERCFWALETHYHPCPRGSASLPFEWPRERRRWERKFTTIHLLANTRFVVWAMFPEQHLLHRVKHLRLTIRDIDWAEAPAELFWIRSDVASAKKEWWSGPPFLDFLAAYRPDEYLDIIDPFTHQEAFNPKNVGNGEEEADWLRGQISADDNFGYGNTVMKTESGRQHPRPSWVPRGIEFVRGAWGREFVNMHHIETFTMSFDACEAQRPVVAIFVERAVRTWRFPLNPARTGYHYLSAAGNPVRKMSWRGTRANLRTNCPGMTGCSELLHYHWGVLEGDFGDCETHWRYAEMFFMDLGPRMYTWTVTWTPRRHSDPEENSLPLHNFVEPDDYDGDDSDESAFNDGE